MGFLLHHSVDESAQKHGGEAAFRFDGASLSYGELAQRSNRLAHVLIESGVRPHDRVGIYMTKSLDLPVALYGILKAGAAYVPIDPSAPAERVGFILRDCGIRHLLTNASRSRKASRLAAAGFGLDCVVGAETGTEDRTEDDTGGGPSSVLSWDDVESAPAHRPEVAVLDLDLAYIMYTSGSTGVPKGLMHTHRSGLAYATFSAREYGVLPEDRLGNHSPLHFDMSTFEYLTAPLVGATTVILPEEATLFPRRLAELIETERLTFWYSVPLALIQLLERGELESRDLSALRWVLFGGEPFPPKHLARLAELWPDARFSNSYGPAEVNQCTAYHMPPGSIDPATAVPIGPVWAGAEGLVVGEDGAEVAPGETGELLIRSATMMRGYWSRPDLNREAFVHRELFSGFDKSFYRTGDLVREDPDGNLHFLGRRDRQIKVRGYRVELDEVEGVLCALEGVAEAAAVDVRPAEGAPVEILAAVLAREGRQLDTRELRRGAAAKLPAYAVPSRIEVPDSLPRTGSGKIDRRAVREALAGITAE